jgi:hypothetical protein
MQAAANDQAPVPGTPIAVTVHGSSMGTPSSAHVAAGAATLDPFGVATLDPPPLFAPRSEEDGSTRMPGRTGSQRYSRGGAHTSSPGRPLELHNANLMWC